MASFNRSDISSRGKDLALIPAEEAAKGKASPPFATSDGRPAGQDPTTPAAYVPPNRRQKANAPMPVPVNMPAQSRPQTPGSYAQRLAPESMPRDGSKPDSLPLPSPASRQGTGSVGNSSRPFKGMK